LYPPLIRFFITELPILPASEEAPMTATAFGFMMRFMSRTMSSCFGRNRAGAGEKLTTIRTSARLRRPWSQRRGSRSISAISGLSEMS
jgi:hypothetical protein